MPDVVTGNYNPAHVSVLLGKGDGTLAPHVDRKDPTDGTRSIAIADLNGDGDADLGIGDAEGRGPPGNFGMNPGNGDGTFEAEISYPPVISGCEVAAGDLDADGRLDLIGTTSRGLGILFGLAGGKLVRGADFRLEHSGTCALAAGDLNGDKRLDVVVKEGPNQISSWLGVGAAQILDAAYYHDVALALLGRQPALEGEVAFANLGYPHALSWLYALH